MCLIRLADYGRSHMRSSDRYRGIQDVDFSTDSLHRCGAPGLFGSSRSYSIRSFDDLIIEDGPRR